MGARTSRGGGGGGVGVRSPAARVAFDAREKEKVQAKIDANARKAAASEAARKDLAESFARAEAAGARLTRARLDLIEKEAKLKAIRNRVGFGR